MAASSDFGNMNNTYLYYKYMQVYGTCLLHLPWSVLTFYGLQTKNSLFQLSSKGQILFFSPCLWLKVCLNLCVCVLMVPIVYQVRRFLFFNIYLFGCVASCRIFWWHSGYFVAVHRLFIVVHRPLSSCGACAPEHWGSIAVVHGLSCPAACGILVPRPGIKPVSPAWQVDSLPLSHLGSPWLVYMLSI